MTKIKQYAFPKGDTFSQFGMTLRDYFAAAALNGWMSTYGDTHPDDESEALYPYNIAKASYSNIAKACYSIADAMLKARDE